MTKIRYPIREDQKTREEWRRDNPTADSCNRNPTTAESWDRDDVANALSFVRGVGLLLAELDYDEREFPAIWKLLAEADRALTRVLA